MARNPGTSKAVAAKVLTLRDGSQTIASQITTWGIAAISMGTLAKSMGVSVRPGIAPVEMRAQIEHQKLAHPLQLVPVCSNDDFVAPEVVADCEPAWYRKVEVIRNIKSLISPGNLQKSPTKWLRAGALTCTPGLVIKNELPIMVIQ